MATILICVYPLAGPINATRKLTRDLRERGHTVHYIGLADCQRHLEDESFFQVFSTVFPAGQGYSENLTHLSFLKRLRQARALSRRARMFIRGLIDGRYEGFERVIETTKPSLMLIESNNFYSFLWELLAFRFNIPSILLNDSLTGPENSLVPPISSAAEPATNLMGHLKMRLRWKLVAIERRLRSLYSWAIYGWDLAGLARQLATGFNFPLDFLSEHEGFYLRARTPEILLVPETFDFPHFPLSARYYTSASVDLLRSENPFPWERLDPALPLIYCSLGTTEVFHPERYRHFFECLLEAFKTFEDRYQLVLATCNKPAPENLGKKALRVIMVRQAPQIALLKRAALMISHGGANSVKECFTLGVPMLLYPLCFDHFGFTARAVFHGVGLRGDFRRVTTEKIRSDLLQLLSQPCYRLQAHRKKHEFSVAEETHSAAQCVETFLPSGEPRQERPEQLMQSTLCSALSPWQSAQ